MTRGRGEQARDVSSLGGRSEGRPGNGHSPSEGDAGAPWPGRDRLAAGKGASNLRTTGRIACVPGWLGMRPSANSKIYLKHDEGFFCDYGSQCI